MTARGDGVGDVGITHIRLAGASALLAASGVLAIAGSAQRWWPACQIGAFDSGECWGLQDDAYDYTYPSSSWTPVGMAAELHGIGMLLLAVAVLLLPGILLGRRPGLVLSISAVVVAVATAVVAAAQWRSGFEGQVVPVPGSGVAVTLSWLGLPALVIALAVSTVLHPPLVSPPQRVWTGRLVVMACLVANNPIFHFVAASILVGYTSYDTNPWSEAVGGLLLVVASRFLWLANYRDPVAAAGSGGDPMPQRDRLPQAS